MATDAIFVYFRCRGIKNRSLWLKPNPNDHRSILVPWFQKRNAIAKVSCRCDLGQSHVLIKAGVQSRTMC